MRFVLAILVALFAPAIAQAQIGPAPGGGGSGITALTGDVTASGTGSVAATVAAIAGVAVGTPTGTTNVVFSNSPTLVSPTLGNAAATSFGLSGNISAAAWTTSGIRYKNAAVTLTDTSSSGTVATVYNDVWGGNTNAASSATTYTNAFGSYFKAPIAGTNVTFTNKYAVGVDSLFSPGVITDQQTTTTGGLAVAFTNGSAVITATNTLVVNQPIYFQNSGGALPTNFTSGTVYYVIATGLSTSQFEVATSSGGTGVLAGSAGSGTQTASPVTQTDAVILQNSTAATASIPVQWSPSLHFIGQGWKTTATAASQTVDWLITNQPIQGTTAPTTNLVISEQINGGGYSTAASIAAAGTTGTAAGITIPLTNATVITRYFGFSGPAVTGGGCGIGTNTNGAGALDLMCGGSSLLNVNTGTVQIETTSTGAFAWATGSDPSSQSPQTWLTSPASATVQFGAANAASPINQTVQSQGVIVGTTSNGAGGNLLIQPGVSTGNATSSQLNFDTWVVTSSGTATQTQTLTMRLTNGAVLMPSLAASSAATTGTVCWTTGGNLTVDTTLACLASLEELKDIHQPLSGALAEVSRLEPFSFSWKDGTPQRAGDTQEQVGFGAHQVAAVDPRLVSYSDDGKLLGVRYQEMTALLVQAIKEQQAEIEELKRSR